MAIVYEKLLALKIPEIEHAYGPKDVMLYALGLGLGQDPMNEDELAFVYEKSEGAADLRAGAGLYIVLAA